MNTGDHFIAPRIVSLHSFGGIMPPLSPTLLVAAATNFLGLGAEADHAPGRMVETFLHEVGADPFEPWDTAFVHHVGYWAHFDHSVDCSTWPLPRTGRANELAAFADERDVLRAEPSVGDVFLMWSPPIRAFSRAGIIVGIGARGRLGDGTRCIA